jgi:four helix bundle protein
MQDHKKLAVGQKAYRLVLAVYKSSDAFPAHELYALTSQMRRAAVSIPANIAEGCGRNTAPDLARDLDFEMGSLSELDCYIMMVCDLGYINQDDFTTLDGDLNEVRRMLISFIQTVRNQKR